MFLTTENVESISGVVTRMMAKHRTQLLSTPKGDLRPRLLQPRNLHLQSLYVFQLMMTFSFFKITLVIIRVWVTNGAQTANGIFQTSISSTYTPLSKIYARRIIPVKLFYHTFSAHFSAFMRADFFNVRVRARWVLARTRTYTHAHLHPRNLPKRWKHWIGASTRRELIGHRLTNH